ncbi:hypothetical protein AB4072_09610 [Microvirga sp. 2MCAF38]|uniref:hypothetical protein n=1 Tax=Microvirga sp. 2MCAF38 TaxID=3232989 RepID=UPI003F9D81DF
MSERVANDLCFSLTLPHEWVLNSANNEGSRLQRAGDVTALKLAIRAASDLRDLPQPDLVSRDAAFLQRDYEGLIGRPAQAVKLASMPSGVTRWSATWIDGNLPAALHALTVETFIAPLSEAWVLELSLSNVPRQDKYDALMREILSTLRALHSCRD